MIKKIVIVLIILIVALVGLAILKPKTTENLLRKNPVLHKYAKQVYDIFNKVDSPVARVVSAEDSELRIQVDAGKTVREVNKFYNGIGMGTFHDGLIQAHNYAFFKLVGEMNKKHRLMNYVNMKCIFMDEPTRGRSDYGAHVYKVNASGQPVYYWGIVDEVIDRILKQDLKPIISLTFMPEAIATDPNHINPWNRGIISPPKDYNQWKELIRQTILHLKERYGKEEIKKWYFEVWNEPDLYRFFWRAHPDKEQYKNCGDFDEYCKLYDYTVEGAVSAEAEIKIGGPGLAGDKLFVSKFLEHCYQGQNYVTAEKGSRIDFVSRHHYGEIEERIIPRYIDFIERIKNAAGNDFDNLEIIITETGPSTHPKPWLNNRYVAAWIVKEYDAFLNIVQEHGDTYLPDIACFWTKPVSMNFGDQFSLVTALGQKFRPDPEMMIKRPAFGAYEAISLMGNEQLALSGSQFGDPVHGVAFKNDNGTVDVLFYHLIEGDTYNNLKSEHTVSLKIGGLTESEYALAQYMIDAKHSNGYNVWKKSGSPEFPSPEQLQILQKNDDLALAEPVQKVKINSGELNHSFVMQNNSVYFLRLINSKDLTPPLAPSDLKSTYDETQHIVLLEWQAPKKASDGDRAASYQIYRNDELIARTFNTDFTDSLILDDMTYNYSVYAVDKVGNSSNRKTEVQQNIPPDVTAPDVVQIKIPDAKTVLIYFNEPLLRESAENLLNYSIDGVQIREVTYNKSHRLVRLSTSPHQKNQSYTMAISNISDLAQKPNTLQSKDVNYEFVLKYVDHFDRNSIDKYEWIYLDGPRKECQKIFDPNNGWMMVVVGDDHRFRFANDFPASQTGEFSIRFRPVTQYPSGGAFSLYLKENDENYYKISNSDGYGPGKIEKYVEGAVVAEHPLSSQYHQGNWYSINLEFSPVKLSVAAFGDEIQLHDSSRQLRISRFEVELTQQDAMFDDIEYIGK